MLSKSQKQAVEECQDATAIHLKVVRSVLRGRNLTRKQRESLKDLAEGMPITASKLECVLSEDVGLEDAPKSACQNCGHVCADSEIKVRFPDIPGLGERVAPGELCPSGECPECGCLMQPLRKERQP